MGENGAGKSTLIKCLAGLKKPDGGQIEFSPEIVRGDVGYLPQQTAIQRDFPASVREVVMSGCLNHSRLIPFYSKSDRERALRNMDLLGIRGLADRSYRELSGGQQQRVLLARALCASNKLLILDEPVTGLDPIVTSEIYSIIKEVKENVSIPVIGNGDIFTCYDAKRMIDETGCDAIMIGRGVLGNPWLIKQCIEYMDEGIEPERVTLEERIEMIKRHAELLSDIRPEKVAMHKMRTHAAYYLKGRYRSAEIKPSSNSLPNFSYSSKSALEMVFISIRSIPVIPITSRAR